eukprot:5727334-Prymnesium_polylepis.1
MRAPIATGERECGDAVERCTTRFRGELRHARVEIERRKECSRMTQPGAFGRTQGNTQGI